MGLFSTGGSFPAGLTPSPTKTLFAGNYLTFDSATGGGTFAQQFLPDVYEKEVERYGNRSVSSFLRMVGAEIPSASDQVIWSEQGRLHIAYDSAAANTTTELSPFTFKTVFSANGAQTIPSIDATGLTPSSSVSITRLVTGDGSTKEQWLTRIFRNPLTLLDTFTNFTKTGVGEGIFGSISLGTPEIFDQFSSTITSFTSTMEMEITDTNGNVNTIFQIPVTIGSQVIGSGITVSSLTPSNFVTSTEVNTTIDSVTTQANSVFVSADRGNDATGTRNSTTKPYATFAAALSNAVANDTVIVLDGDFTSEGDQTFSTNINIHLHHDVEIPNLVYNGSFLRVKGLGNIQKVGDGTGVGIDTSGGSGRLLLEKLFINGGLKLSTNSTIHRFDNVDVYGRTEFDASGGSLSGNYNGCIFSKGAGATEDILIDENSGSYLFNNCIIGDGLTSGVNAIEISNSVRRPSGLFFKDCIIRSNSSQSAFNRSNATPTVNIYFAGGTTGISYFSNESDFNIEGNYIVQTNLNSMPNIFQQ